MKKTLVALGTLLAATIVAPLVGGNSPVRQQQKRSNEIRVQTDLDNILASVIDANGRPIPDLTQDAFQLSDEGVSQQIERFEAETNRPLDLALMVDSSMSA